MIVVIPVALRLFGMISRCRGVMVVVLVLEVVIAFERTSMLVAMHDSHARSGQAGQERQDGDHQTGERRKGHGGKIAPRTTSANSIRPAGSPSIMA